MTGSSFQHEVEDDILARVRAGDRKAQEQVFRTFQRPVYNLALRISQDPDEAMDVLQDTFVNAFGRAHQFKGDAPFWGWLRQIAVNECLGRMRRYRRREVRLVSLAEDLVREHPDQQLDLADALGHLPADTRAVVWLYDVEGYSHQEIAALFGRSVSFSKTQLSRAHARLRELLDRDGGGLCTQTATP